MKRFLIIVLAGFTISFLATIASVGKTAKNQTIINTRLISTPPAASGEIPTANQELGTSSSGQPR